MSATIIDIRNDDTIDEKRILFDTNILYFIYYDKYSKHQILCEKPTEYKLILYEKFYKKLLDSQIDLFISETNLFQFVNLIEDAELKILYNDRTNESTIPEQWNSIKKGYRDSRKEEWLRIQKNVIAYCNKIKKHFSVIKSKLNFENKFNNVFAEWENSISGIFDALIVSEAKENGISAFLSDDGDFAAFEDINLYTANISGVM